MEELLEVAKALSDRNRVRALVCLREGELCLCQIIEMLGLSPSTVSKHMSILRQAGLVRSRKEGRWQYYRLTGREVHQAARLGWRWVEKVLVEDPAVRADACALRRVLSEDKATFCEHYRR